MGCRPLDLLEHTRVCTHVSALMRRTGILEGITVAHWHARLQSWRHVRFMYVYFTGLSGRFPVTRIMSCGCCGDAQAKGLAPIVHYNAGKVAEVHLAELAATLQEMLTSDPPASPADTVAFAKARKAEWVLPDVEIVKARPPP